MKVILPILLINILGVLGFGLMITRFYRKVPAGKAGVMTGVGGMKVVTGSGIFVIPMMHSLDYVHAEAEAFESYFNGEQTQVVVQLKDEAEHIKRAYTAFGGKDREETRHVLQTLIDTSVNIAELDSRLEVVGYHRV
ncbi:MAG: hypothetical protein KDA93_00260 [Planctomycetaceae bacterium]|nr:hypothetical protein [Planctomycetaceae bacterium]